MRLSDHQAAFAQDLSQLIHIIPMVGPRSRVRMGHAYRSSQEQQALVDAGITKAGPDISNHPKRLACDLIIDRKLDGEWVYQRDTEAYRRAGMEWERMSVFNRWGGRYNDGNHFERLLEPRREAPIYA